MIELTISKLIYSETLTYLQFVLYFFMSAGSTAAAAAVFGTSFLSSKEYTIG